MTLGEVISVGREVSPPGLRIDLAQPDTIRHVIREVQPDLIVNPAAYTAVDKAESEPELAMAVNGTAPGVIAEEAKLLGAGVIHYSTDYVFNGNQAKPYTEQDEPDPQNVYGKTKLAGERQFKQLVYLISS
jgi:dTDP-4-dehydrorhamnose reductase